MDLRAKFDLDTMLAFGRVAVQTRRFDTDVPRIFFDVVKDIETELNIPPGEHIYGRPDIWPQMEALYEGYVAEPTQARWHSGWRSVYGIVAYFAGQYDKAREQFEQVDWQVPTEKMAEWGRELSLMTLEVAARTGPLGPPVAEAESAFGRQETVRARELYGELEKRAEADERTRRFIGHRLATLRLEEKIQSGDWAPLLPSGTNDPAWAILAGEVRTADDGTVEVASENFGHMVLCRARLGAAFEVRGEMEITTPAKESGDPFGAGIALGSPTWDAAHWYSFRLTRDAKGVALARFSRNWGTGPRLELTAPVALKDGRNTFQLTFQDHRVSAKVNDRLAFDRAAASPSMRIAVNNHRVALTADGSSGHLVVKYRKLEVRKQ